MKTRTNLKRPCHDCQRTGLTMFWGRCVRCQNQRAKREQEERTKPKGTCPGCSGQRLENARLQAMLDEALSELREWEECYAGQIKAKDKWE